MELFHLVRHTQPWLNHMVRCGNGQSFAEDLHANPVFGGSKQGCGDTVVLSCKCLRQVPMHSSHAGVIKLLVIALVQRAIHHSYQDSERAINRLRGMNDSLVMYANRLIEN